MAYYDFLNLIFSPLFKIPLALAILILSFLVSLIIILITKYTTDQALMKRLKEEIKEHQSQIKQLRGEPAKAMEIQKKAMELNMKYMMHSLKPTLITFIPIILIFGWMSSVFAYESIKPNEQLTIHAAFDEKASGEAELVVLEGITIIGNKTQNIAPGKIGDKNFGKQATWALKGVEGEHLIEVAYSGEKQQHTVLITEGNKYTNQIKNIKNGPIKSIQIGYKKKIVLPIGFKDWFGWLGAYIWSSIIFTMILRKSLKVY